MKRTIIFAAALCLSAFSSASASVFWDHVSADGAAVDEFKDASRALFFDRDGSGTVNAGDVAIGLIRFGQKTLQPSEAFTYGATQQVIAAYAFTVGAPDPVVAGRFTLLPTIAADPLSLYSLSNAGIQGLMPVADWNKTFFVLLDKDGVTNPVDMDALGTTVMDNVIGNAAGAAGWTVDEIGGEVKSQDFLEAQVGNINYAVLGNVNSPLPIGQEAGGLTIQYDNQGITALNGWLPVNVTHLDLITVTSHDITFTATIEGLKDPVTGLPNPNWTTQDSSNFDIDPVVPEPASVVVWGLLTCVVGLVGWFRRRAK